MALSSALKRAKIGRLKLRKKKKGGPNNFSPRTALYLLVLSLVPFAAWVATRQFGSSLGLAYLAAGPIILYSFYTFLFKPRPRRARLASADPPEDLLYRFNEFRESLHAPNAKLAYYVAKGSRGPAITPVREYVLALSDHMGTTSQGELDFALAYACIQIRGYSKNSRKLLLFVRPSITFLIAALGAIYLPASALGYIGIFAGLSVAADRLREREINRCKEAIEFRGSPQEAIAYLGRYRSLKGENPKQALIRQLSSAYGLPVPESLASPDKRPTPPKFNWYDNFRITFLLTIIARVLAEVLSPAPKAMAIHRGNLATVYVMLLGFWIYPATWHGSKWLESKRKRRAEAFLDRGSEI